MYVKLVSALWMNYYCVNLISFNFFVFNETVVNHFDFCFASLSFYEQHSPYIDLTVTISDEESTFVIKDYGVWMLGLHKAFVACGDFCVSGCLSFIVGFDMTCQIFKVNGIRLILWVHDEPEGFIF